MRIVIADDAALTRDGLATLLTDAGVEVLTVVGNADDLIAAAREHLPDAVITDIRMPPAYSDEGIVALRSIRSDFPGMAVLVLSLHIESDYARSLVEGGSERVGYLLKERVLDISQIVTALEQLVGGGTVVDPAIVESLMARHRRPRSIDQLTARERDVLTLMAEGLTNVGIAERLHLSRKTVEAYVTSILDRLGICAEGHQHRRVQAVLHFLEAGRQSVD